jgi:hypothetical protein
VSRAPRPLHFPAEAEMLETFLHLLMRTLLFQVLVRAVGRGAAVGSEQFICVAELEAEIEALKRR